jgi:hypothetical protein
MLPAGFPRLQELLSLQRLHQVFAETASGQEATPPEQPIQLCHPEFETRGGQAQPANFSVRSITLRLGVPVRATLSRELLYQIFFTAFILCRDLAEAVKAAASEQPKSVG